MEFITLLKTSQARLFYSEKGGIAMKKMLSLLLCLVLIVGILPLSASAATEVSSVSLSLDYPEAGKNPPGTATWYGNGYSLYDIEWFDRSTNKFLEPGDTIQAGHQYQAVLWVEAHDGYVFSSVDDNTPGITAYVNGKSVEVVKAYEYKAWAMVCLNYYFSSVPEKGWVRSVNLTVAAPVTGERPNYTQLAGTEYVSKNASFNGQTNENMKNGIAWESTAGVYVSPDTGTFAEKTEYIFRCLLFPQEGYRFVDNAAVYVNGNLAMAYLEYDAFLNVKYQFPATGGVPHTHTPSDWRTTGAYHYTVCTTCGEFLEQEDHKGGEATCEAPAICTVCGYAYIEPSEDYHVPDTSKWVARIDMYHFHPCKICGAHCDIEDHRWSPKPHVTTASGHAYQCADCMACSEEQPHIPGPAATQTTPQTCTECGYIIAPAKNHVHDLSKVPEVPATCTQEGNIEYYVCTGCMDCFTDPEGKNKFPEDQSVMISALGHKISDDWKCDENHHWRTCTVCNEVLEETKMVHETENGKCATCGYGAAAVPDQEKPEDPQKQPAEEQNGTPSFLDRFFGSGGLGVWLIGLWLGVVCVAAVAAVIIIIAKKNKRKKR